MGLDDRERRPQLVRRVGGELELAAAGRLDRRGDPPADGDRAEEHAREQERRDEQRPEQDRPLGVSARSRGLGDDDPVVADVLARDPEPFPLIVAVTGAATSASAAGRSGVPRRDRVVPSAWTVHTRTRARTAGRVVAG